jgi:hypothetical protein
VGGCSAIAIDGKADALDLTKQLIERGVPKQALVTANAANVVSAAGMALNAIRDGQLHHTKDDPLRESALSATRRKIGEGFGFGGECPQRLESCALALWAARTSKYNPNRKGRAGC